MTDSERGSRAAARKVTKKRMVDALNHVNFRRESVIVNLEHVRYGNILSLRAFPEACMGDEVTCLWADPCPSNVAISYVFKNLMVDRGLDLLLIGGDAVRVTGKGVTITLPEGCEALQPRKAKRYACQRVKADLMQNGASFSGSLEDFTASSFRVLVSAQPPQSFGWIDEAAPVYVVLTKEGDMLYSGACRIVRQTEARRQREFVVEPIRAEVGKAGRDRLGMKPCSPTPSPSVVFDHPLTGKKIRLEADEISPCWFSLVEYYDSSVLFAGLVISNIEIEVVPGFSVKCRGQVTDGTLQGNGHESTIKWPVVVVDMAVEDQGRLFAWLQRLTRKSLSCGTIDLDDLLTFFFDTGFVYPKKYASLQSRREEFRDTYRRLYLENPSIARHFIHMNRGMIQGHLSMIRFYENTWLMHHHASTGRQGAGLEVLNEATDYISDYRCLYSSHMDYLICYFRADNRFPNRVFGGFAEALAEPKNCSVDSFAYFTVKAAAGKSDMAAQDGWKLDDTNEEDLSELKSFYEQSSGGLLIEALDLEPEEIGADTLTAEYTKLGFSRQRSFHTLKKEGEVKAVLVASVSDIGLNMSNLTNCLHVFVMDQEDLPFEELCRHLGTFAAQHPEGEVAILLYPVSFADRSPESYEKIYNLWAFDTRHTSSFYEYMGRIGKKKAAIETNTMSVLQ